ncbi:DNA-binding protein D-ETS-4-like isoform X1 [Dermacentor variabilis]|uniref:DNA-binding protein D-ETS-4-like isoform X1 n=1 Tax=Dermacentor variabilis TaxID=34621 RepID=UPI003F5AE58D
MLKSLVSPHYPAVEPRHQLVPSPSHSAGVASPVSMADTWGMNELGVWFDESENGITGALPVPCRIKQEPQSAPSSPQSCMMNNGGGGNAMLDYPALLEELVNVTKNCVASHPRSAPTAIASAQPPAAAGNAAAVALVAQPGSPSMYDEPCAGLVRCHSTTAMTYAPAKACRPPPPSYDQRLAIKTEDCAESDAAADCCTSLSADKLDQLRLLAMQQAAKDIDVACQILNISPNPYQWSVANVHSWLVWTQQQYGCPSFRTDYFNMNGPTLCSLSEEDFRIRAPGSGDIFSAQLEIWKSAAHLRTSEQNHQQPGQRSGVTQFCPEDSVLDLASLLGQTISGSGTPDASPPRTSPLSHHSDSHSEATHSDDDASDTSSDIAERCLGTGVALTTGAVAAAGRAPSSSHIHLWQFLKELLSQPQLYGSCIRWLDRNRGVFKIEDSVRVARLWGKRKNRPAMNYDKLSRSIRQYYKKGIMKKTERSQRLVYQFCAPYSC